MKQLNVTTAQLREAFECYPEMWVKELAIVNRLEQMTWRSQQGGRKKLPAQTFDIYQLGLDFGADFALNALRISQPKALANQIAQYICLDVARAGLNAHPIYCHRFNDNWHEQLREFIGRGGDVTVWDDWCQLVITASHGDPVFERITGRVIAALCGHGDYPDVEEGGLDGLLDAVDDLAWLLVHADARYTAAKRIADLALNLERRWQNGTRLEFEFIDEIDAAMETLEEQLTPEHEQRALGVAWAALVLHTRGEAIRPVAPMPAMAEDSQGRGAP